jgi:LemA protein
MKKIGIVVAGILVVLIVAIMGYRGVYNTLVQKEQNTREMSSQIDNQLQRRADLIPNLVNVVKGYAKHENEIFTKLADARAAMAGAKTMGEKANANANLDSALSRLMVVVENYPNLKANENFLALQDELAGTENRIAVARRDYNASVKDFNSYYKGFFVNMFFGSKYKEFDYFTATQGAKEAPKVNF